MAHPVVKGFVQNWGEGRVQIANAYYFNKDDVLPIHVHRDIGHSALVVKGSVEAFDSKGKSKIVKEGAFVIFKINVDHGLRALEDGTITVHVNAPR